MSPKSFAAIAEILKSEGITHIGLVVNDFVSKGLLITGLEQVVTMQVQSVEIEGVRFNIWQKERLYKILQAHQDQLKRDQLKKDKYK